MSKRPLFSDPVAEMDRGMRIATAIRGHTEEVFAAVIEALEAEGEPSAAAKVRHLRELYRARVEGR